MIYPMIIKPWLKFVTSLQISSGLSHFQYAVLDGTDPKGSALWRNAHVRFDPKIKKEKVTIPKPPAQGRLEESLYPRRGVRKLLTSVREGGSWEEAVKIPM